jgi:chromosome segregation ATPase
MAKQLVNGVEINPEEMRRREIKTLEARRQYLITRIGMLREEIDEEAKNRAEYLERLRSDKAMTNADKEDLRTKYNYSGHRYKDARSELQAVIAEGKALAENLKELAGRVGDQGSALRSIPTERRAAP